MVSATRRTSSTPAIRELTSLSSARRLRARSALFAACDALGDVHDDDADAQHPAGRVDQPVVGQRAVAAAAGAPA